MDTNVRDVGAGQADAQSMARLLRIADAYIAENSTRQAMEMYFSLVENYRDTPEAGLAKNRLMAIAERYENAGKRRQARAIYERFL